MKRLAATALLCLLFPAFWVVGKGPAAVSGWPDSLRSLYLYTEGIKQYTIFGDSIRARELLHLAIGNDSTYAPAYYELASNGMYSTPEEAVALARRAHKLDTTNIWYHQFYGQALVYAQRYAEALRVYRHLTASDPKNPDNYRLLAALYEQQQQPYSAIATLDSAELRFGRFPILSAMKRQLLVTTRQFDKAIEEARALIDAAPYEPRHHVVLADLYAAMNKDSLARTEYARAMEIDSTSVETLMSLSDFYNKRHDYRAQLDVNRQLFRSDDIPLETKIRLFGQYTSDMRFYREYYFQINDLASVLAIRHPNDKRVVVLYAGHLIASGELPRALELYKIHTQDTPPDPDYFKSVIDIESYLQHTDSVDKYVTQALKLFPNKPEFHISKGHVMTYSKQYGKAIDAYKNSLRYADSDSLRGAIWGLIGDAWHEKADAADPASREQVVRTFELQTLNAQARKAMKECYKAYDRSLHYYADNAIVQNNYAYFLSLEGRDLEKALSLSSRAIVLSENNATYLDTHAWVLFRLGRAAEAKKVMQQAIALDNRESPDLMIHYGDILFALGEQFMAETYWQKALEKGYDAEAVANRLEMSKKQSNN